MKNSFRAIPANPYDERGQWIDESGQYVYRSTGWELNPRVAKHRLKQHEHFLLKVKKLSEELEIDGS